MFKHFQFHHHMRDRMREFGGGGGGLHSRGPKIFDAGALRYIVLQLIAEKPRHGYEIIKEIEQKVGGGYSPSPGVIYPLLSMLQDQGYVTVTSAGNKNLHTITGEGGTFLDENRSFVDAIKDRMATKGPGGRHDARNALLDLKRAVVKFAVRTKFNGTQSKEEQFARLEAILREATAAIDLL